MKESFISWNEYAILFKEKSESRNIAPKAIQQSLLYGRNLFDKKLPIVYNAEHLSFLTGYRLSYIVRATKKTNNFYRHFNIPKKNGHTRSLSEPLPGLKSIQYWILNNILQKQTINKYNYAYTKGKSIKSNAKFHTKQPIVLNIDIENYFQNIPEIKVYTFFHELGYNSVVSKTLAKLCSLDDGLAQGSPISPILSNLLTIDLDVELFNYCRSINCRYSRYADDITISGEFDIQLVIKAIRKILEAFGFKINNRKIRAKKPHQRQMVTGLVVNRRISIKKVDLRLIRQEIFYIKTKGLESHLDFIKLNKSNYLNHLLGKIDFYLFIKPENLKLIEYKNYIHSLLEV